ncbi:arginase family protein [Vibrio sp. 404]|uniref:Arginase family protein n=1 Tax=Vibrio marinisediminis TaxID=2758441 RepID=A0A7W2IUD7_9VIBR|nr:arginase family protein [Vibrio marinisediminis]MBA5762967.1 arginase family protein [Vibrio marinisediminis]
MPKSFDIIGAPFNQLGCYPTKDNTVDGLRRLDESNWIGLSDWVNVRNNRWNADIRDLGDVKPDSVVLQLTESNSKEKALSRYANTLKEMVLNSYQNQRTPITLGGDHSIAIGTVQATLEYFQKQQGKRVAVIWIDAHADCNDSVASNLHGKPLAMLMDKYPHNNWAVDAGIVLNPQDVYYVAVRDLMPNEDALIKQHSMVNFDMTSIETLGISNVLNQLIEIIDKNYDCAYVSFDYDALDGSLFRACGTPNVGGLSAREALHLVDGLASHPKFVGIDFVEYLPELDQQGISKELMIKLIDAVWGFRS